MTCHHNNNNIAKVIMILPTIIIKITKMKTITMTAIIIINQHYDLIFPHEMSMTLGKYSKKTWNSI
jgi:hypothetical protein